MNDAKLAWMREQYGENLLQFGQRWAEYALRTSSIELVRVQPLVEALYALAGLRKPRVVIVPSPGAMAFAGGIAASVWDKRKSSPDYAVAERSTTTGSSFFDGVTRAVVEATTDHHDSHESRDVAALTLETAYSPADLATVNTLPPDQWRNIRESLQEFDALLYTDACIRETMRDQFGNDKPTEMMAAALEEGGRDLLSNVFPGEEDSDLALKAITGWWKHSCAGNTDLYWTSCVAAARDVEGLRLAEHAAFSIWENLTILSGYRYMHPEFCILSDFPETIDPRSIEPSYNLRRKSLQERRQAPSYRWRDGWVF